MRRTWTMANRTRLGPSQHIHSRTEIGFEGGWMNAYLHTSGSISRRFSEQQTQNVNVLPRFAGPFIVSFRQQATETEGAHYLVDIDSLLDYTDGDMWTGLR